MGTSEAGYASLEAATTALRAGPMLRRRSREFRVPLQGVSDYGAIA